MYVESIEINNFRNYKSLNISLDQGINVFYGNNAQGKTNLLEAIYIGGTTRSHKGSKDKELIRFGNDESHIRMMVRKQNQQSKIDMHLKKNRAKGIAINGTPIRRASELLGFVNMIFFSPEDLNMIKSGPSERRKFMNMELGQLDSYYLYHLVQYNRILNQRNALLKEIPYQGNLMDTLQVWDEQLIQYGSVLMKCREQFAETLNSIVSKLHFQLSGGREHLEVFYEPDTPLEQFEERIVKERERDLKFRTTTAGPHRDDLSFMISGVDIRKFGSQGQQRTCALSLKMAEIEMVRKAAHDTPVLLLDDVLSELDSERQNCLLDGIRDIQTLITCTGLDEFIHHQFSINKLFKVTSGTVKVMNDTIG